MRRSMKLLTALTSMILFSGSVLPAWAEEAVPGYNLAIPCTFEEGTQFSGGQAIVKQGGKYGLINEKGSVVADFVYDEIMRNIKYDNSPSDSSYRIVVKDRLWGVIDRTGQQVIPCRYNSVLYCGEGLFQVGMGSPAKPGPPNINGVWGLWDTKIGKEIVAPQYTDMTPSGDASLLVVNINGKYGLVDRAGKVVIPIKYNSLLPSSDFKAFIVTLNNKTGVLNQSNHFTVPMGTYEIISTYQDGYALVQKNYKYGLINTSGKLVIPAQYSSITTFRNQVMAEKAGKFGVLDMSGRTIIPFSYDYGGFTGNGAIYLYQKSNMTVFNNAGKVIAAAGKYNSFSGKAGDLIYLERDGKVGAIDLTGKEIVPFIYTGVRDVKNGLAYVTDNDKAVVINQSGKVILPLAKYGLINLRDDGYVLVISEVNGRQGLFDSNGKTFLDHDYYTIGNMNNNYIVVSNDRGSAVFDKGGEMVVPFEAFDNIGMTVNENMISVQKDGLVGYINLPEYIAPPDEWAKAEVGRAIAAGLVPDDMRRDYQGNITRADFCRLAVNMIEVKTGMQVDVFMNTRGMSGRVSDPIDFTDTTDPLILAASRLGIVKGVGNDKFNPTGFISRQDAAVMLQRTAMVLDLTELDGTPQVFADRAQFALYAVNAIDFVSTAYDKESGYKVMGGTGNDHFSPLSPYTRQQAYLTMLRLYNS